MGAGLKKGKKRKIEEEKKRIGRESPFLFEWLKTEFSNALFLLC